MIRLVLAIAALLVTGAVAAANPPEIDYMLQCQGCHRADGGATPGSVPPLDGLVARFLSVSGGREYLVRVPGSAQSSLDDAALARLLNWIIRRFGPAEFAANVEPFTAAEIAEIRTPPLTDVASARADLLARMGIAAEESGFATEAETAAPGPR